MLNNKVSSIGTWDGIQEKCEGWECCTIGDKLIQWSQRYGERIAAKDGNEQVSFSELNHAANILGKYFKNSGINKGDFVVIQLENNVIFLKILFGLFKMGAIPILMLPAHREYEIEGVIENAKPSAYISMNNRPGINYEEMANKITEKNNIIKILFFEDQLKAILTKNSSKKMENITDASISYTDIVLMLLSGGTTGIPKLIPRTHGDYLYFSLVAAQRIRCDESTIHLIVIPASHNFALAAPGILGTLSAGGKVILSEYASPIDIFDLIEEERVNVMSLVPTMVTMCLDYRKMDLSHDISSLEKLITGSIQAFSVAVGKIIYGVVNDKWGMRCMALLAVLFHICSISLILFGHSSILIVVGCVISFLKVLH